MAFLTRWDPFRTQYPTHSLMNELFREFLPARALDEREPLSPAAAWTPRVNLKETADSYEVEVELPGIKPEDVEISFKDDVLTLKGERKAEKEREGETFHVVERTYGSFSRSFRFATPVDADSFNATAINGLLVIAVAKATEGQPKKIEIKNG